MRLDHKIGIIGGGPAGSSMALYLASMNFDVCVFEKKLFPRETVCGEFLSHEVIAILKELNLYEKFLLLKPNKITKLKLFNSGKLTAESNFEFDAFSLKRSTFDNFLLSEAQQRGATVYQPAMISDIKKNKDCFNLYTEDKKHFFVEKLIAAFGKSNIVDRNTGRNNAIKKTGYNGVKFHIKDKTSEGFPSEEIHIYIEGGFYLGVSSPLAGELTFCYLENRISNKQNPYEKISKMFTCKNYEGLDYKIERNDFKNIKKYGIGKIYFGNKELVKDDVFYIGDSARVIAPLTGDGIGMAFETSKLLSSLLYEFEKKNWDTEYLKAIYINKWNHLFLPRLKLAKSIQNLVLKKSIRDLSLTAISLFPSVLNFLTKKTRSLKINLTENI